MIDGGFDAVAQEAHEAQKRLLILRAPVLLQHDSP